LYVRDVHDGTCTAVVLLLVTALATLTAHRLQQNKQKHKSVCLICALARAALLGVLKLLLVTHSGLEGAAPAKKPLTAHLVGIVSVCIALYMFTTIELSRSAAGHCVICITTSIWIALVSRSDVCVLVPAPLQGS
jgi:cobalamin synthase